MKETKQTFKLDLVDLIQVKIQQLGFLFFTSNLSLRDFGGLLRWNKCKFTYSKPTSHNRTLLLILKPQWLTECHRLYMKSISYISILNGCNWCVTNQEGGKSIWTGGGAEVSTRANETWVRKRQLCGVGRDKLFFASPELQCCQTFSLKASFANVSWVAYWEMVSVHTAS